MAISTYKTVQSFVQSLWSFFIGGGQLVDQNTANMRAAICASCHNNKESGEIKRSGCCGKGKLASLAINTVRSSLIKDKKTTSDSRLLACGLCGCDLKIKVWFPLSALGQTVEEANAWPSFCWRKKILEGTEI